MVKDVSSYCDASGVLYNALIEDAYLNADLIKAIRRATILEENCFDDYTMAAIHEAVIDKIKAAIKKMIDWLIGKIEEWAAAARRYFLKIQTKIRNYLIKIRKEKIDLDLNIEVPIWDGLQNANANPEEIYASSNPLWFWYFDIAKAIDDYVDNSEIGVQYYIKKICEYTESKSPITQVIQNRALGKLNTKQATNTITLKAKDVVKINETAIKNFSELSKVVNANKNNLRAIKNTVERSVLPEEEMKKASIMFGYYKTAMLRLLSATQTYMAESLSYLTKALFSIKISDNDIEDRHYQFNKRSRKENLFKALEEK